MILLWQCLYISWVSFLSLHLLSFLPSSIWSSSSLILLSTSDGCCYQLSSIKIRYKIRFLQDRLSGKPDRLYWSCIKFQCHVVLYIIFSRHFLLWENAISLQKAIVDRSCLEFIVFNHIMRYDVKSCYATWNHAVVELCNDNVMVPYWFCITVTPSVGR